MYKWQTYVSSISTTTLVADFITSRCVSKASAERTEVSLPSSAGVWMRSWFVAPDPSPSVLDKYSSSFSKRPPSGKMEKRHVSLFRKYKLGRNWKDCKTVSPAKKSFVRDSLIFLSLHCWKGSQGWYKGGQNFSLSNLNCSQQGV